MHTFFELVQQCTAFTLNAISIAHQDAAEKLQISSGTPLVKTLQMVQLQKTISAIGVFSMFDAILQEKLHCDNGFREACKQLGAMKQAELKERFENLQLAINVLKHGRGRSYDELVQKADTLPFRVKLPDETFFNEGDMAEISTLIEVDDDFVLLCTDVIHQVSLAINKADQSGT